MKTTPTFNRILIFSLGWLLLNLLQAMFTDIIDDEAYYWTWSHTLDWGYFDHPPMIALLIKAGYFLFSNVLGVRLMNVIMGASTIFLALFMLKDDIRDSSWIFLLVISIPLMHFHVAGFLATPDIPLVFFSTVFLFLYRKYLSEESPVLVMLLALTIALMLYSKYHSILVIGFTVLSNLKLLRRRSFWLIVVISLLLYSPHILWQVKHNFVSFNYHLVERNTPFRITDVIEFIGSQILLLGPVTGFVLLLFALRSRPGNPFRAALKYNVAGFMLLFLISTLKGHVEAHWTAAAFIPLLLYSVPLIPEKDNLVKFLRISACIMLIIMLLIRILLISEPRFIPPKFMERFADKEVCMNQIHDIAGDRTVVFNNSYQDASLYTFYTGMPAFSQNNKNYRKNQYDLMNMEAELIGQQVLYVTGARFNASFDSLHTFCGTYFIHETKCFCQFNRVEVIPPDREWNFEAGDKMDISLELRNLTKDSIIFLKNCSFRPIIIYSFYGLNGSHMAHYDMKAGSLPDIPPCSSVMYTLQLNVPETPGEYSLLFSIGAADIPAGINGKPVRMTVVSRSRENSESN